VRGVIDRRLLPILGSVAVALLYGGALRGLLPIQQGVSWQSHLFGLIGGVLAAWAMSTSRSGAERREPRARVRLPKREDASAAAARREAEAAEEQLEIERELAEKKRRL